MATIKGDLRLEDIPCMNLGKYMLQVMTQFDDGQAIVSFFSPFFIYHAILK